MKKGRCIMWKRVFFLISCLFLMLVLNALALAKENSSVTVENPIPVYYETVSPAARTQIGNRGLRAERQDLRLNQQTQV